VLLQLAGNVQIWKFAQKAMEEKMSVAKLEDVVVRSECAYRGGRAE